MERLEEFRLNIKPHSRAKRMKLRYDPATKSAVVTIPRHSSKKEAARFAERHIGWLRKQKDACAERRFLTPGTLIPIRGENHVIQRGTHDDATVSVSDGEVIVGGIDQGFSKRLENFLKKMARRDIEPIATEMAKQTGVKFKKIQIRDTKSRWGSCSTTGTLSFSWRLIMTPPDILEYVVAHEVAHLSEMNHSSAFWDIVDDLVPDAQLSRRWLKNEGQALMLILGEEE